jgi:hypothetical protein
VPAGQRGAKMLNYMYSGCTHCAVGGRFIRSKNHIPFADCVGGGIVNELPSPRIRRVHSILPPKEPLLDNTGSISTDGPALQSSGELL